jgi:hypothetical protein
LGRNSKKNYIKLKNKPLLSICIPSFQRIELLRNTLNSIYSQAADVTLDDFEVIVSDNDPQKKLQCLSKEFNYENYHYFSTNCEGFLNSFHSLTYANGLFIKLHNSQMMWEPGSLKKVIDIVRENQDNKAFIFWSNGVKYLHCNSYYYDFDSFLSEVSYQCTWSNGFSIWKDDFDQILQVPLNNIFPQTSLLLTQKSKLKYVLCDLPLFKMQKVPKKGGYNVFNAFGVEFLKLIESSYKMGHVSKKTFKKIKIDLLLRFFPKIYFKTNIIRVENYDTKGLRKSLSEFYPFYCYYIIVFFGVFFVPHYIYKYLRSVYLKIQN